MSLNTIELPQRTLADFYKNTLVETSVVNKPAEASPEERPWSFLGENKQKVLVVVNYPDIAHIPDKQLDFLTKLLSACKLNLGDTAILNFNKYSGIDFNSILSFFGPKTIFLYGVDPQNFGLPVLFPQFQIQSFNQSTYLFVPALEQIEVDKILKSKLWECLKKIFNL